ncbi:Hypothetical predicted protein [Olea europaea subsp. europaea]|uniref:Uncharacterized protein n=1 Tax=Olea europaea subsp. europaea TaxID=158383 RepID=A0A8S0SUL8_OLEEU|nr:Hypothetical predicted protein [Olea europaea subsp. europaea]
MIKVAIVARDDSIIVDACQDAAEENLKGKRQRRFLLRYSPHQRANRRCTKIPNCRILARYENIICHWGMIPKRQVQLEDFRGFELTHLIQICGWDKIIEKPHPVYESTVREFYANLNSEIEISDSEHLY